MKQYPGSPGVPGVQTRADGNAVSINLHGRECFRLEQDGSTAGVWRLYPVLHGERGTVIDHDRFRAELLERIESVYMDCTAQYFMQIARLQALHFGSAGFDPSKGNFLDAFFDAFTQWIQVELRATSETGCYLL